MTGVQRSLYRAVVGQAGLGDLDDEQYLVRAALPADNRRAAVRVRRSRLRLGKIIELHRVLHRRHALSPTARTSRRESQFTVPECRLPMGDLAISCPSMSSTRSRSVRMPTSLIRWYSATVSGRRATHGLRARRLVSPGAIVQSPPARDGSHAIGRIANAAAEHTDRTPYGLQRRAVFHSPASRSYGHQPRVATSSNRFN